MSEENELKRKLTDVEQSKIYVKILKDDKNLTIEQNKTQTEEE